MYGRQGARPSPRKRNAKKQNGCVEEALQIAVKRREVKGKGERERYTHFSAVFQRIAMTEESIPRRSMQIEENKRIGKTRDLFKKIKDNKGTFHAKMGSIKEKWSGPNRSRRY